MSSKYTTEYFIIGARKVHGNYYDYSKVVYVNCITDVIIICPIHGEFHQTPHNHLNGKGCPICGGKLKLTTEEFIIKAKKIHGDYYDYSKVDYVGTFSVIIVICPVHGEFRQIPNYHLSGNGCPKCGKKLASLKTRSTTKRFIINANKVHNRQYIYGKTSYINAITEVTITCPTCGDFSQLPYVHLNGAGCPKCFYKKISLQYRSSKEKFIKGSKKVHGYIYDYSRVDYINSHTEVIIGCKKHGWFSQIPSSHLAGRGCPDCQKSKGELSIIKLLDSKKIKYTKQKTFKDCINPKTKWKLKFDFELPEYKILIEYNGRQHYEKINYWHQGKGSLKNLRYRDQIKKDYAISHGYKFIVIKYTENIEEILNRKIFNNNSQKKNKLDVK